MSYAIEPVDDDMDLKTKYSKVCSEVREFLKDHNGCKISFDSYREADLTRKALFHFLRSDNVIISIRDKTIYVIKRSDQS